MFEDWLTTTRELQTMSFGADPSTLQDEKLAHYIRYNMLAAANELLGEGLAEFDWKPWVKSEHGFLNRDAFVGEMVDVLHFVANMLVAANCTDEELSLKYKAKQQKNRDRMADGGYSAVKAKCPMCGRNYDEETTKCQPGKTAVSADGKGVASVSPYCAHTYTMNDATVNDKADDEWEDVQLGTNISVDTEVRVKADAYVGRAAALNESIQHVATIRHGKVELRHSDGKFTLHTPDKLEVRKTHLT